MPAHRRQWCSRARSGIAAPVPAAARAAHDDAIPPGWTTTSTSSSSPSVSTRRGVSVRITGRDPSGSRNSLPFHAGITSRRFPAGNSTRTLAAGSSTRKPSSSGPPSVTRRSRGVTGTTRRTSTRRNRGGSRRTRSAATFSSGVLTIISIARDRCSVRGPKVVPPGWVRLPRRGRIVEPASSSPRRDAGDVPPWDMILRTTGWDVVHAYGTALEGWLVLATRRHITAVADMDDMEARELGPLVQRVPAPCRTSSAAPRRTSPSSPRIPAIRTCTSTSSPGAPISRPNGKAHGSSVSSASQKSCASPSRA